MFIILEDSPSDQNHVGMFTSVHATDEAAKAERDRLNAEQEHYKRKGQVHLNYSYEEVEVKI